MNPDFLFDNKDSQKSFKAVCMERDMLDKVVEYRLRKINLNCVLFDDKNQTVSLVVDDSELVEMPIELFSKLFREKSHEENMDCEKSVSELMAADRYLKSLINTMKDNGYSKDEIKKYIADTVRLKDDNISDYKDFISSTVDQAFSA